MDTLASVNVGLPRDVAWRGRTIHTGIHKQPVSGPVPVRRLNLDGDGQGDLAGHGGEQRAVLVYQTESYDHWRKHFRRDDLAAGAFGENFTVTGMPDDRVCIGDRYRIGDAEFEVTQPRVTCFRVGMRLGEPDLPRLLVAHRRPGFYLRVIREGLVEAGDEIVQTRHGPHRLSVAEVDGLLYLPDRNRERLRLAAEVPALSPGWAQSFRELLTEPSGDSTPKGWKGFRPLRVVGVQRETADVVSIELADDQPLPRPTAGDYIVIRPDLGTSAVPLRSYSLSGDPAAGTYRISVKREARGTVSPWVHTLGLDATVHVAAPRGAFHVAAGVRPVVLLSAGIGATPLLAMLYDTVTRDESRRVIWAHTTREPSSHAFAAEVDRLAAGRPTVEQHIYYTRGTPARRLDRDALAALDVPRDSVVAVCGPLTFMDAMRTALRSLRIDASAIHTETFGTLPPINPGATDGTAVAPHPPPGPPAGGPQVTFSRAGLTTRWGPRYASLLELAEACDVPTRYSCRSGVCHVCTTGLVAGDVTYPEAPLDDPTPGSALMCCAVPLTDVVLDV